MEQLFRFGATISVELMIEATCFVSMGVCFCTSAALVDDTPERRAKLPTGGFGPALPGVAA